MDHDFGNRRRTIQTPKQYKPTYKPTDCFEYIYIGDGKKVLVSGTGLKPLPALLDTEVEKLNTELHKIKKQQIAVEFQLIQAIKMKENQKRIQYLNEQIVIEKAKLAELKKQLEAGE
ncbi:hypothetical protein [Methanosarcina sp.]|uniref:hypothetical protein n=1 Tax=Methanosarcina sp. TaxID=2213 RepID=UPI002B6A6952|nr:hypothetical protein [Methanosarcina sp.]HOW13518.1 hypothetical protein [Methanosarcina sp.]